MWMELLVHYVLSDVTRMIPRDPLSPRMNINARSDPQGHTQIHADSPRFSQIRSDSLKLHGVEGEMTPIPRVKRDGDRTFVIYLV